MDNEEKDSAGSTKEKAKKTGTLNLEGISISTLKDDLAKKDSQAKEGEGGVDNKNSWFSFLAKHQSSDDPNAKTAQGGQTEETKVTPPVEDENKIIEENRKDLAEISQQGIEELKIEKDLEEPIETKAEESPTAQSSKEDKSILEKQLEAFKSIGAPKNLPISEPTVEPVSSELDKVEEETAAPTTEEKAAPIPPLSSFITPKIEAETQNQLSAMLAGSAPEQATPTETASSPQEGEANEAETAVKEEKSETDPIDSLPKIDLDEEEEEEKKDPLKFMPGGAAVTEEKPVETTSGDDVKNPFSSRLGARPGGDNSLLQSVESALNYSASPEYAEERARMEDQIAEAKNEATAVEAAKPAKSGLDKKWLIIGGSSLAGVVVLIIVLVVVLGGSKQPAANNNVNTNKTASNSNDNGPIRPLNNNTNKKPVVTLLKAEKVIPNVEEVKIGDKMEITSYLSKMRTSGAVSKMTQLVFIDSNGSAVSFKDLMDTTEISIPEKVITDPSKTPAVLIADFFAGKTILGLVIKSQSDTITTLEKMKSWEATMIMDLGELWKGLIIDNPNAYFDDSGMFKNGRFALIDKKSGLSLDYLVENGYILIACGRDSMTILKSKLITSDGASSTSDDSSGETESATKNPEPNANANGNGNDNSATPKAKTTVPSN